MLQTAFIIAKLRVPSDCREEKDSRTAIEILRDLLKSPDQEWAKSKILVEVLRPILMRLCAR